MSITVDGVVIQDCSGVDCDNINMVGVNADSTRVYTEHCEDPAGSVTIDYNSASGSTQYLTNNGSGSWTFKVPFGYSTVQVCMVGGGATGESNPIDFWGGRAGSEISRSHAVTSEENIAVVVGRGGQAAAQVIYSDPGDPSKFDTLTANGGNGVYDGNGGAGPAGCGGGGYHDGIAMGGLGGQASSFGNGGNGGANMTAPGIGAGSGGVASGDIEDLNGGNGRVIISWS